MPSHGSVKGLVARVAAFFWLMAALSFAGWLVVNLDRAGWILVVVTTSLMAFELTRRPSRRDGSANGAHRLRDDPASMTPRSTEVVSRSDSRGSNVVDRDAG